MVTVMNLKVSLSISVEWLALLLHINLGSPRFDFQPGGCLF